MTCLRDDINAVSLLPRHMDAALHVVRATAERTKRSSRLSAAMTQSKARHPTSSTAHDSAAPTLSRHSSTAHNADGVDVFDGVEV